MALLPEVHVSLDRPTIQHIYQLFLPVVPGGTLVIGLLLSHPGYFVHLGAVTAIGYYSRLTGLVFLAYVAGLLLYALSVNFGFALSFCLTASVTVKMRPIRDNQSISRNHVWRTVASRFLGNELTPRLPNVQGAHLFTCGAQFPQGHVPLDVQNYDMNWNDWYNVLQDYVLRGVPPFNPDVQFFVTMVQAATWAVLIDLVDSGFGKQHAGLLALISLLIFLTAAASFGANFLYFKFDRLTAADFTARLLAEIRKTEAPFASAQKGRP